MGMHPKTEIGLHQAFFDLLFGNNKEELVERFAMEGLIDKSSIKNWLEFLNQHDSNSKHWQNSIDYFKCNIDALVETNSFLSTKQPLEIVNNFIGAADSFGVDFRNIDFIRNKTILDFGAGVYRTLAAGIILYCNGFDRVIAYEPFPVKVDYVQRSFYQLIEIVSNNPEKFKFSNISKDEFISRLKIFICPNTNETILKFAIEPSYILKIGGLTVYKDIEQIPLDSIDVHFSNAVLEHVVDLNFYMSNLNKIAKLNSIGIHIVDFLDHRYYDDNKLSPMEKYFDGINDEINGVTPSEMEFQLKSSGWTIKKIQSKLIPDYIINSDGRKILERYSSFSMLELREHVNIYMLLK